MIESKNFLHIISLVIGVVCCLNTFSHAQNNVNVQVKVYNKELNPFAGVKIIIEDTIYFTTNSRGLAFISIPSSSLPPKHIKIADDDLEPESWNYSKGILEILIRKKKYQELIVKFFETESNNTVPGLPIKVRNHHPEMVTTDQNGEISIVLSINANLKDSQLFTIDGYKVVNQNLDDSGGSVYLEKTNLTYLEHQESRDTNILSQDTNELQTGSLKEINQIDREDIDSITSLTDFYPFLKNIDYRLLDENSRKVIDEKYNQLIQDNSFFNPRNSLELITDSSLVDQDIQLILEKIYYERDMLNQSIEEFEKATNHISDKLKNGGTNLSTEERRDLIQLVLSIKEMLKRNEEIFNQNNSYYMQEVDALLGQLANIHELEDMLKESEAMSEELKKQLIYAISALLIVMAISILLVYLVRLFRKQKQKLYRANQEIQRMNENLEEIVSEKTKSLELINDELDTFMYRSSHNLRRPITSIRGLANIAQITLGNEALSLFDKVVLTANEMEKMLNKLAMMSYINQPTDFGRVDLTQVVNDIQGKFESLINKKNIQFNKSIPSDLTFETYPFVFESLLINLLENAFFFSNCKTNSKAKVDLQINIDEENKLILSVRDNGCGINPEIQDKIWNMFFVGNEASKGNGLGLFIARKAVESLHGSIKFRSEVGKFTEFVVELPELHPNEKRTLANQEA